MLRRPLLIALLVALASCAQSIGGIDEGANDGGSSASDGATGADAGESHPDASGLPPDASTSGAHDAGSSSDAGGIAPDAGVLKPELSWGSMTLPPSTRSIHCVWGDVNGVYAGGENGRLFKLDRGTGTWSLFKTLNQSNAPIDGLSGANGRVYAVNAGKLSVISGVNVTDYTVSSTLAFRRVRAVSDTEIWIAGVTGTGPYVPRLYLFDGAKSTEVWSGTGDTVDVFDILPFQGAVFIATNKGGLFRRAGGITTQETVNVPASWSGTNNIFYLDMNGLAAGTDRIFAGGFRSMIFERNASKQWDVSYGVYPVEDIHKLAAWGSGTDVEVYAVGEPGSAPKSPMLRYDGKSWAYANVANDWNLVDIVAVGRDEWYAVGLVKSGIDGVILGGTR